jgi:hypothetical protein
MGYDNVGSLPGEAGWNGSFLQYLEDNVTIQMTMNNPHPPFKYFCWWCFDRLDVGYHNSMKPRTISRAFISQSLPHPLRPEGPNL